MPSSRPLDMCQAYGTIYREPVFVHCYYKGFIKLAVGNDGKFPGTLSESAEFFPPFAIQSGVAAGQLTSHVLNHFVVVMLGDTGKGIYLGSMYKAPLLQ